MSADRIPAANDRQHHPTVVNAPNRTRRFAGVPLAATPHDALQRRRCQLRVADGVIAERAVAGDAMASRRMRWSRLRVVVDVAIGEARLIDRVRAPNRPAAPFATSLPHGRAADAVMVFAPGDRERSVAGFTLLGVGPHRADRGAAPALADRATAATSTGRSGDRIPTCSVAVCSCRCPGRIRCSSSRPMRTRQARPLPRRRSTRS